MNPRKLLLPVVSSLVALCLSLGIGPESRASGALAVGQCDRFGYTYNYNGSGAADAGAIANCAATGDRTCSVVVRVNRECLAFSVDNDNPCGARGWGYSPSRAGAEALAIEACRRYGGRNCVIRVWSCDGG